MKVSNKLIDEVVAQVAGEDVIPLVSYLKNKKNISEFKIAECIKVEINLTRNMLYRLFDHNLVSFIRRKDKKKGWYIYYCIFNLHQAKVMLSFTKKLDDLKSKLSHESLDSFFSCPKDLTKLKVDYAMEHDFKCPECGTLLKQQDNEDYLSKIKKEIGELEEELSQK